MRKRTRKNSIMTRPVAGDGVRLEPQLAAHAADLYAVIRDPALYAYIDSKEPESEVALRERLRRLETRLSPDGAEHWLNWVVITPTGEVAGYVQATVTPDHSAEIAYVLGRAFWRRGLGYAACRAMLALLRADYGVTRVTATLDPANAASMALLAKLGLTLEWSDVPGDEVGFSMSLKP